MLNKRRCPRCEEKTKSNHEYCSNCGLKMKDSKKEWGMLGKNDYVEEDQNDSFSGLSGGFLNKMVGSAMKMLEKEFSKEFEKGIQNQRAPNTRIKLMINGKEIVPKQIKTTSSNNPPIKTLPINFSNENLKKFQKLSKKEPKTQVRRIGDKVTYEVDVPGVKSIEDVSIIKLESSIEIRAVSKDKAYFKNIPITLPITKYILSKEKLSLELDTTANSQLL